MPRLLDTNTDWKLPVIGVALVVLAFLSRPDQESFVEQLLAYAQDQNSWILQGYLYVTEHLDLIKFRDYLLFATATLPINAGVFLGIFGVWIPLPKWVMNSQWPTIKNGICMGRNCFCLPSYLPPSCLYTVRGFHSLSEWIFTSQGFHLPNGIANHVLSTLGILELLILTNVVIYTLWLKATPTSIPFLVRHFTLSWNETISHHRLHALLTSAMSHRSVVSLLVTVTGIYGYGRELLGRINDYEFLALYLALCLATSMATLLFSCTTRTGYNIGGIGVLVGLRTFGLLSTYGWNLDAMSSELQQIMMTQLLVDGLLYGGNFPWGSYVGGVLFSIVWYALR
ncbi:hypothetical protein SmJEL517_g04792 [Synchytrium microbalum]|uniref:Peptidase S54 rhomboid domain-containing protein n=1 Tax=Synchytrium microbalum TaxID=1806994 RepID=A0A507C3C0_9FUNG|nr:uncharacterized protein SmJEL517_g04792 [Synchytrium microbalum]TPX32045.1 hypothetical protein SmJEL517_g04792 [Synchytrium microbalum]